MRFFEKSLMTLELPAVLEMLAAEAVGDTAKEQARALTPSVEPAEVRRRQEETTAAKTMMVVRGSPSFSGVKDVRPSLARAAAARIWRRMLASSGLAPSAISSSPLMEVLIFSSRNLLAWRA